MARTCTVCTHPERAAIDQALVSGTGVRALASRYVPLSKTAVQRHRGEHLPAALRQAQETKTVEQALDVVQQLRVINQVSVAILHEARSSKDGALALRAIDRLQ